MDEDRVGAARDEQVHARFEIRKRELHVGVFDQPVRTHLGDAPREGREAFVRLGVSAAVIDDQESAHPAARLRHHSPSTIPGYQ